MAKWSDVLNRFRRGRDVTLKASGAETSSTTGAAVEMGGAGRVTLTVDITAASGTTPTMTVVIEGSIDGTTWFTIATVGLSGLGYGVGVPSNFTGVSATRGVVPAAPFMRYRSVIGGTTPSFTYSVLAEAND